MDLGRLSVRKAAAGGAVMTLKDPATKEDLMDGDKPVTITLRGAESETLREKRRELDRRKANGEEISDERRGAEMLAALVVDWSGIGLHSEETLPCTFGNAVRLFMDPDAEWLVEQIRPFSMDRRNFVKNR